MIQSNQQIIIAIILGVAYGLAWYLGYEAVAIGFIITWLILTPHK